jgi:hypothetical protein
MQAVTTIGLDIAKSVFQIHGVDAAGNVIVRRQLKRRYVLPFFQKLPPCLVGIEASRPVLRPAPWAARTIRGRRAYLPHVQPATGVAGKSLAQGVGLFSCCRELRCSIDAATPGPDSC